MALPLVFKKYRDEKKCCNTLVYTLYQNKQKSMTHCLKLEPLASMHRK